MDNIRTKPTPRGQVRKAEEVACESSPLRVRLDAITRRLIDIRDTTKENLESLGGCSLLEKHDNTPYGNGAQGQIDCILEFLDEIECLTARMTMSI